MILIIVTLVLAGLLTGCGGAAEETTVATLIPAATTTALTEVVEGPTETITLTLHESLEKGLTNHGWRRQRRAGPRPSAPVEGYQRGLPSAGLGVGSRLYRRLRHPAVYGDRILSRSPVRNRAGLDAGGHPRRNVRRRRCGLRNAAQVLERRER